MAHAFTPLTRTWRPRLPTAAAALMLLLAMILITNAGEMLHGQLLKIGESWFGDTRSEVRYFELRSDPVRPVCDAHPDIELAVRTHLSQEGSRDVLDSLFGSTASDPQALRASIAQAAAICARAQALDMNVRAHLTPAVRIFRSIEEGFAVGVELCTQNRALLLLTLLALTMAYATAAHHHICLRPPRSRRDHLMQAWSMVACNAVLLISSVAHLVLNLRTGLPLDEPLLQGAWIALFGLNLLAAVPSLTQWRRRKDVQAGSWRRALECVPLVATMGLGASLYFFTQGHWSGPAIYAAKLLDFSSIPMALALHIWAGMLFKQSSIVDRVLDVLRPWRLSPEALTYLILLAAGLPTAYAGVSSVFVIAAGAIVYQEVRAVGGAPQFALAATAMSGSLGAVLSPSLLVVAIAALNRQVTTSQLFHWGNLVFLLTSTLFFLASQIRRHRRGEHVHVRTPAQALPQSLRALWRLSPYVAVSAIVVLSYRLILDTPFNDISAPSILPVVMLALLWLDRRLHPVPSAAADAAHRDGLSEQDSAGRTPAQTRASGMGLPLSLASRETLAHAGAYLALIVFTQMVGGMVERSEIMNGAPTHWSSVWATMSFLMVAKVLLGMVMEPIGAIVLVSGTLAPIAYANGISPVHFWMMVLVAFELGYLLPPVALNQLLTRQVVGEAEIESATASVAGLSFYRRHERWLLPCLVMSVALLIVAYGPLALAAWAPHTQL